MDYYSTHNYADDWYVCSRCKEHVMRDMMEEHECQMTCPVCDSTALTSYGCLDCGEVWNA